MSRRTANGRRITGPAWAVVFVSVVAACTDAVAPPTRRYLPSFSYSPNGAALNQVNGTLNENGQVLIKGFNPTNPHHGDAIVATFYWLGSTNIIDNVDDVLTDAFYTPVGNTYTLVEYVTAGGYSMATYVATNVQNFPDPNDPSNGVVLAVRAHLTQPVTDGGLTISSWSGIDDNPVTALGEHRSASGSSNTTTTAAAGPITVDAGAIVYTVTMGQLAGLDQPTGFAKFQYGSDAYFNQEVAYNVAATTGTVNPGWTWYYGPDTRTWLVTTLALRAAPPPPRSPSKPKTSTSAAWASATTTTSRATRTAPTAPTSASTSNRPTTPADVSATVQHVVGITSEQVQTLGVGLPGKPIDELF